jgi:hypothetical protein
MMALRTASVPTQSDGKPTRAQEPDRSGFNLSTAMWASYLPSHPLPTHTPTVI